LHTYVEAHLNIAKLNTMRTHSTSQPVRYFNAYGTVPVDVLATIDTSALKHGHFKKCPCKGQRPLQLPQHPKGIYDIQWHSNTFIDTSML